MAQMTGIAAATQTLMAVVSGTLLAAAPLRADPLAWQVDETLSTIALAVPDQVVTLPTVTATIRVRNPSGGDAGPWNVGNVAALDGTIVTDYVDGVSIEFLSGLHNLFALNSGNYRPNPAVFDPGAVNAENPDGQFANTSTAPGVFGARARATVSIFTLDAAYFNFTEAFGDVFSNVLPISAGSFPGNSLVLGFDSATVAFDGLSTFVGQPIPDAQGTVITDALGFNTLAGATITSPDPVLQPDLRRLTIPFNTALLVTVGGIPLSAGASGTIVAFATIPEPGFAAMFGSGALLLAALDRRRSRRARG